MRSATPLKIGVIGVGKMGALHLAKYIGLTGVDVVGVYDSNVEAARRATTTFNVKAFSTVEELLFEADAVSIATSTESHHHVAKRAFEAGVHVLLEKPIAETVEQAQDLCKIARERGLVFQIGFVERFRYRVLSRTLSQAKVLFVESDRLSRAVGRESQIDVVSDLMIHDLDLALSIIGEEPSSISAIGLPVVTPLVDVANARLEFPGGAVVNLNASRVSDKPMRKFRVFSLEHYASVDFMLNSVDIARRGLDAKVEHMSLEYSELDALRDQCMQFVECVQRGGVPIVTGEDGLRALRVVKSIKEHIADRMALRTGAARLGLKPEAPSLN
jgi:predicted dehydrogenase